jgi:hypothetical protein
MTKKDYELIAQGLRLAGDVTKTSGLYDVESALGLAAQIIADSLGRENVRFNESLFLKACGVSK